MDIDRFKNIIGHFHTSLTNRVRKVQENPPDDLAEYGSDTMLLVEAFCKNLDSFINREPFEKIYSKNPYQETANRLAEKIKTLSKRNEDVESRIELEKVVSKALQLLNPTQSIVYV